MSRSQPVGFAPPAAPSIPRPKPPAKLSFDQFSQRIEQEFVEGSAIAPSLYAATVDLITDIEPLAGGEVTYPIHEALGWNYTRFGRQANATLYAAVLKNENGSLWQLKLSDPRVDRKKGKIQKYETPVGNGSRAFLPAITVEVWAKLAQANGVEEALPQWVKVAHEQGLLNLTSGQDADEYRQAGIPDEALHSGSISFWDWLQGIPQIPIVITEGGKKGLAGFSQGYVVLALYGCHGGYRSKDELGTPIAPYLIPDVARFAVLGRRFVLAFDQDAAEKTRRRVKVALSRFSFLLMAQGCEVEIAQWHISQGKGLDDLIVQSGPEAWHQAYANAVPFTQWQILQRLEQRLTYPANLEVNEGDLSKLDLSLLPTQDILAVVSAKGTGKTKLIAALVAHQDKVLAITHRIALGRNLCTRLGLDYRGDIDRVQGDYINGEGYTLRIGSCVDGLLSIDPSKFIGCDLVLDEVTQVLRHLLTSSTCSKEGKRPVLLARFGELVRNARRLILADADLDNATLSYLRELRGESNAVFLIRNQFKSEAYHCQFIQAPDRSAITGRLLLEIAAQEQGQVLFVATDSKATSESLTRIIEQQYPQKRVLVLNSKTSGGEFEREFMQYPDLVLERGDYDIIICSPSVATGVSIECRGIISKVYGIFTGVSSNDGDISQSLSRVREPVERIVWCAKVGSNYSKVSRSLNALEVKYHLESATTATVQLIRSSLKADVIAGIEKTDWQADPHIRLYCQLAAEQNYSMRCLRDALLTRLHWEGNRVTVEECPSDKSLKELLAKARTELQLLNAEALVATPTLTYSEVLALEQKESLTPEEALAISKFHLMDFYCLDELTVDDCLWDNEGRRRGEIVNLEAQLFPQVASDRASRALEKQGGWGQGYSTWDISYAPLRKHIRERIGLTELIQQMAAGWSWCKHDLKLYADRARAIAKQIKVVLHFTITEEMSDTQIIHQLLSQMGIKFKQGWSRTMPGHEGEKLRTYSIDRERWQRLWAVLQRRDAKRQRIAQASNQGSDEISEIGSPPRLELIKGGGDPALDGLDNWLAEDVLADIQQMWMQGQDDPAVLNEVTQWVPEPVLRYLGLVA